MCALPASVCRVRRRVNSSQNALSCPVRENSSGDHVDLFVGQHPSGALGEGRHRSSAHAVRHDFAHCAVVDDGKINRVGQRDGCTSVPSRAVTARAVFCDIGRKSPKPGLARLIPTPSWVDHGASYSPKAKLWSQLRDERRDIGIGSSAAYHCLRVAESIPGASTPARRANDTFSWVGILAWRTTTMPATSPKATCDATNQNQSMWLASNGFNSAEDRVEQPRPQHRDNQSSEYNRTAREHGKHGAVKQSHKDRHEAV